MINKNPFIIGLFSVALILAGVQSCSKKHTPTQAAAKKEEKGSISPAEPVTKKSDSSVAVRKATKRTSSIPKVITVNDKFASKSVDGRLYYDLEGHRYWRNYTDGKYYLFNKSMQTDAAFKKPSQK